MVRNKFTALDKINLFISIYGRMFIAIFRFSWWSPFFILALIQLLGFLGLLWYYLPGWIHIIQPTLKLFLPERAFHFPQYYLVFPGVYTIFEIVILGPTLWVILSAAAVIRLGGHYSRKKLPLKECLARARAAYLPLLGVWLIETLLVLGILSLPSLLMESVMYGSPNMSAAISFVMQSLAFVISAALLYTIPAIVLDKKGLGEAIANSVGIFFGNFFLTYFIIFIPGFIRIILNILLTDYAQRIIVDLNPELIPLLLFGEIVLGIFINLFIYGSTVFVYREMSD
jgi:hypothetical protein